MKFAAVILAAGGGKRMKGVVKDKTMFILAGKPVLWHSAKAFADSGRVSELIFVVRDARQKKSISDAVSGLAKSSNVKIAFAKGGAERQDSVLNGLRKVGKAFEGVLIHDSARPLLGSENMRRLCDAVEKDGAAVLANRVSDTIKRLPKNRKSLSKCPLEDLERARLWAMQTPQAFKRDEILSAYEYVSANKIAVTDDVGAARLGKIPVSLVENAEPNPKITVPSDIDYLEFLISKRGKVQ